MLRDPRKGPYSPRISPFFVDVQSISMWLIVIDYQKVPTATLQEYEYWHM